MKYNFLPFASILALALLAVSCGQPEASSKIEEQSEAHDFSTIDYPPKVSESMLAKAEKAKARMKAKQAKIDAAEPVESVHPSLSVRRDPSTIKVSGRLKSERQKAGITKTLTEAFPEYEVRNEIVVESNTDAVGWGYRVAEMFLVPFLQEVDGPAMEYQDGIITLHGGVKNNMQIERLQILTINTFSGPYSRDIDNQLVVLP